MARRNLPNPLRFLYEDRSVRDRFVENLFPRGLRQGERCPGDVIRRLEKGGCPLRIVIQCLFGYAYGSDEMRKGVRELIRLRREAARIEREAGRIGWERLLNRIEYVQATSRDSAWVEDAERAKQKIRRVISHLRGTGNPPRPAHSLRELGLEPLEWLVILQCFARCIGTRLTEGELAAVVWAAVSAVHPNAKTIETDSLAQALRRFHKRNSRLDEPLTRVVSEILARHQKKDPPERRRGEDLQP